MEANLNLRIYKAAKKSNFRENFCEIPLTHRTLTRNMLRVSVLCVRKSIASQMRPTDTSPEAARDTAVAVS